MANAGLLKTVRQWQRIEIPMESSKPYGNPYAEIDVTVVFRGPEGTTIRRPAFWDGGNIWSVRFAPTHCGRWHWSSSASDPNNTGLHGQTGEITCMPYSGDNPNYRHGFIRIDANRRAFVHADGTAFFWLGDTHWQMPDTERVDTCNYPAHDGAPCPFGGQFQHLASERKAGGFSVYQTYPSAINDAWWREKFTCINPERFQKVFDVEMDHLADEGFVIALGCGHFNNSIKMPLAGLQRWARYLVARYGAHPVTWITAQEINAPEDGGKNRLAAWLSVAEEIERNDGYGHPHSGHQWVLEVGTRPLGREPWHDWFALQGGHRNSALTPQARYAGYYAFQPAKPMVETEAMYEQVDCGGRADSDDARMAAWKAFLCGCAGYTYGAAGIWALKWDAADTRWKDYNQAIESWYQGMSLPGAAQMTVLKNFFSSLPWISLTPTFCDPAWSIWDDSERCVLATISNRLYLAYCHGKTSKGELRQLDTDAAYAASWFDPRSGAFNTIESEFRAPGGTWRVPEKPEGDWLLYVSALTPQGEVRQQRQGSAR